MSFRRRLALSCAAAVAVVVVFGSGLAYWIVSNTLHDQIDSSLRDLVAQRVVDLRAQRVPHDPVREPAAQHDHQRHRGAAGEDEPAAEAHCSRNT